jgi:hypothetical protein
LGQPSTTQETIATIWTLSLQRIRSTPVAQELLSLEAFLGPDDLPRDLLVRHPEVLPEPLAAAIGDQLGFQQALGVLRRYSLLTVTEDVVSMHRLVQAVVRHQLDADGQQRWTGEQAGAMS